MYIWKYTKMGNPQNHMFQYQNGRFLDDLRYAHFFKAISAGSRNLAIVTGKAASGGFTQMGAPYSEMWLLGGQVLHGVNILIYIYIYMCVSNKCYAYIYILFSSV